MLYQVHLTTAIIQVTTLVVVGIDWLGRGKSKYIEFVKDTKVERNKNARNATNIISASVSFEKNISQRQEMTLVYQQY